MSVVFPLSKNNDKHHHHQLAERFLNSSQKKKNSFANLSAWTKGFGSME